MRLLCRKFDLKLRCPLKPLFVTMAQKAIIANAEQHKPR